MGFLFFVLVGLAAGVVAHSFVRRQGPFPLRASLVVGVACALAGGMLGRLVLDANGAAQDGPRLAATIATSVVGAALGVGALFALIRHRVAHQL